MLGEGRAAPDHGRPLLQYLVSRPINKPADERAQPEEIRATLGQRVACVYRVAFEIKVQEGAFFRLEVGKSNAREQPINQRLLWRATLKRPIVGNAYVFQKPDVGICYRGLQASLGQC